jgi:hypothetical protein
LSKKPALKRKEIRKGGSSSRSMVAQNYRSVNRY